MKIVFLSNFFNHHQKPLSDALYAHLGDDYAFIETREMTEERKKMGWGGIEKPPYVKQTYTSAEDSAICQALIDGADVVLHGSAPASLIAPRLRAKKLTFHVGERPYKQGLPFYKVLRHAHLYHKKFRGAYFLAASAFASADFKKVGMFRGKAYKWGYFTALYDYESFAELQALKNEKISILWVSRLIPLKHPEAPIAVAAHLRERGIPFDLNMIGNGPMEESVRAAVEEKGLGDSVHLLGAMTPDEVRAHMEKSNIFLFTSDKNEGWGAVLNEAMNSGCATVASHAIGSVPFLIEDGKNGLIYESGNHADLCEKVARLAADPDECRRLGEAAYFTMKNEWNAENAAEKLLVLCEHLLSGEKTPAPFAYGVCSPALPLRDDWIRRKASL